MDKGKLVCSLLVLLVAVVFGLVALAGEVFMNDSGEVARAFRIVFSEQVEITSFGGAAEHVRTGIAHPWYLPRRSVDARHHPATLRN